MTQSTGNPAAAAPESGPVSPIYDPELTPAPTTGDLGQSDLDYASADTLSDASFSTGQQYSPSETYSTGQQHSVGGVDVPAAGDAESGSTAQVAKDQAGEVKDTAIEAGRNVAGTTKQEASNVVAEVQDQATSILHTVTSEVREQAGTQQQRVAGALHSLADELGSMATSSSESGPLTDLAHQASRKGGEIADWLENREPGDVVEEVKRFARRRPVTFLILCGAAGVLAGRMTRGAIAKNTSVDSEESTPPVRAVEASPTTSAGSYLPSTPSTQTLVATDAGHPDPYVATTTTTQPDSWTDDAR